MYDKNIPSLGIIIQILWKTFMETDIETMTRESKWSNWNYTVGPIKIIKS